MTPAIVLIAIALVCFLVWLVATYKVTFPLLFDFGLAVITLGVIVWADAAISREQILNTGTATIIFGLLILLASFLREKKRQRKCMRTGEPREINGNHIRHIHGGKQ